MLYAEVAVNAPVGTNRTFTYSIPLFMALSPGQLVSVPFGPRLLRGVVFELEPDSPMAGQTRDVAEVLHPEPVLHLWQIQLARWLSRYYMAPLYSAAALMLPPEARGRIRSFLRLGDATRAGGKEEEVKPVALLLDYLLRHGRVEEGRLQKALGTKVSQQIAALIRRGQAIREWEYQKPKVGPGYLSLLRMTPGIEVGESLAPSSVTSARARELWAHLQQHPEGVPLAQARKAFGGAVATLQRKGLAAVERQRRYRDPLEGLESSVEQAPHLTPAQEGAFQQLAKAIRGEKPQAFLLHGVTGSGKTEVYMRALEEAVANGKGGIVLVPEISLTPQTVQRFSSRFPGRVAVLHSGLTPGQYYDQWWQIRAGSYDVVVGSRSALFAPQPDLGLIVIDEEQEWTYKQEDPAPRYHARDVAIKVAEITSSVVVLGSATPDVVSFDLAQRGGYRLLELPQRIRDGEVAPSQLRSSADAGLPEVEVVDMAQELREGNRSIFSRTLRRGVAEALEAGGQVILFLNRRGAATFLQCRSCGYVLRCRSCDVTLTYHSQVEALICHQCNRRASFSSRCPQCGRVTIKLLGLGTQRVVEEVSRTFPGARVLRWDRDVAHTFRDHQRALEGFLRREAHVLVGTQLVAKGLHLPGVRVVGVLLADLGLHLPDYRAGERVFQTLCQVAGRAGRGPERGKVVIQTYSPHHYAVAAGAAQDYQAFYRQEMAYRKALNYPPFSRLIRLLYEHTNPSLCRRVALQMSRRLQEVRKAQGMHETEVIGPAPAYPPRARGRHRWHILIRGPQPRELLEQMPTPQGWLVDVDPVSLT